MIPRPRLYAIRNRRAYLGIVVLYRLDDDGPLHAPVPLFRKRESGNTVMAELRDRLRVICDCRPPVIWQRGGGRLPGDRRGHWFC